MPGGDQWSCGLRTLAHEPGLTNVQGNALALAAANRWKAFANSVGGSKVFAPNGTNTFATIEGVTVRELNNNGVTVAQYEAAPSTAGTNNGAMTSVLPNQCSLVVTLLTARAGRTGKGRIYLPAAGFVLNTAGRIATADIAVLVPVIKTMLDGLNTDLNAQMPGVKLAVQSAVAAAIQWPWTGTEGAYVGAAINSFRVGDVVDTQRRRRASLIEAYTSAALV
jgi:hypothetical protein